MKVSLAVIGILSCVLVGSAFADIRATHILFRHGQRTPAYKMGTLTSELAEDIGYGQLTKVSVDLSNEFIRQKSLS